MQTYRTREGDVLDQVVFRQYGRADTAEVLAVLAANPGLAAQDAVLPAGVVIELPEIAQPAAILPGVSLWD